MSKQVLIFLSTSQPKTLSSKPCFFFSAKKRFHMAPPKRTQMKVSGDKPKIDKASKKIFKRKEKKQNDAAATKSEKLPLQLEDEVPDFPRGCTQSLSVFHIFLLSIHF